MSEPFIPGLEQGTSLEGNIELSEDDLKTTTFKADDLFEQSLIAKHGLSNFGDKGFLLKHVLSPKECKLIIDNGEEAGFEEIRGVRDDYRSCKRITIVSDDLASTLWARVRPFLEDIIIEDNPHIHNIHGVPSLMKGTWKPVGLNNLFRLCRYLPGGHFAPHFDGHYDRSPAERSLKTLMVYLNGDFSGGNTNFVDEKQTLYKDKSTGKYCAEEKNIMCSIQPEAGLTILFNHHRLHEGAQLKDGKKYILRTDVMYRNTDQNMSEKVAKAMQLLQQAETLENAGQCSEAMEMYRKAFKLAPELENAV